MTETPCSRCGALWPDNTYWYVLLDCGHGTPVCRECVTAVEMAEAIVNEAFVDSLNRRLVIEEFAGWFEIERRTA